MPPPAEQGPSLTDNPRAAERWRRLFHAVLHAQHGWQRRPFTQASVAPERTQALRLRQFLRANADTAYGRAHRFGALSSVGAFQEQVPVVGYEPLRPFVERAAAGEAHVLTREPILFFETTSGSTGGAKWVPCTRSLLAEFQAGIATWLHALWRRHPGLWGTQQYWSLSPVGPPRAPTAGGHRVGAEGDAELLGPLARWATARLFAVPSSVAHAADIGHWRRQTLRGLVGARALGLFSVWSPSFLSLLMAELEHTLPDHLAALPLAERRAVEERLQREGRLTGEALWPRLQVVSCWMDAGAALQVPALRAYFPRTPFQGKGLLATEGMVSFPLGEEEEAPVAAAAGHFLEFIDLAAPHSRLKLVHELREGGEYQPVLTTGAGFARYRLEDVVRCEGRYLALPRLRFLGRADKASDLCGEKLHSHEVDRALARVAQALGLSPAFALLVPEPGTPAGYRLFLELLGEPARAEDFAERLEAELQDNPQYAYARRLGQLRPLTWTQVQDGWACYVAALVEGGMKAGDVKPAALELRPKVAAALQGAGPRPAGPPA